MLTVLQGHCLDRLRELPDESVQCVVTSPPYWGLRDYGIPPVSWPEIIYTPMPGLQVPFRVAAEASVHGLEPTLHAFIAHEVAIFREVRRVLKSDGVCWVNMGDGYAHGQPGGGCPFENGRTDGRVGYEKDKARGREKVSTMGAGLPPKSLLGQPWRVAFALQADGWFLRQDVIWHKPNPMPESVRDRCTKAHEYLFLLTKRERYYWDQEAVREPTKVASSGWAGNDRGKGRVIDPRGVNPRSVWSINSEPCADAHFATFPTALPRRCILAATRPGDTVLDPFGGSGTTGRVALDLGRRAILIEMNPDYLKIANGRTTNFTPCLPL